MATIGSAIKATAALLLATIVLSACGPAPSPERSRSALAAANAAYDTALRDGDAAALSAIYTDDFSFIGPEAQQRNKDEQIATMTDDGFELLDARSDEVRIAMLSEESGLVTGRFRGRYRIGDTERAFVERYTSVWVLQRGAWRVRHEHSSMEPAG